jgi:acyl carrier protein
MLRARPMEHELLDLIRTEILDTAEPLTQQDDLFAAGLDSMGIMQLLLAIEDRFGVAIDPADLSRENFSTAEKIAALIAEKRAAASR